MMMRFTRRMQGAMAKRVVETMPMAKMEVEKMEVDMLTEEEVKMLT